MFRPNFRITPAALSALMRIEADKQAIAALPIGAAVLQHLRETAAFATTHYSTAIEGNRLTLPEVRAAHAGKKFPGRERDETEVRNHFRAVEWMEALAERRGAITEPALKRLHGLVMHGRNKAFPYRDQQNVIRDSASGAIVYLPPEPKDVPGLMRDLVTWINGSLDHDEWPAPVVAALAHYQFATIHPYMDGNGRAARLLASLIVRRQGYGLKGIYSLDEYYAKNLSAYYAALTIGSHNYYDGRAEADVTVFVDYFCIGMADAFTKVRAAATEAGIKSAPDHSSTLRDLTPTQRKLIDLFRRQGSATTAEMAAHLRMSPRTLVELARQWIEDGFLEYVSAARKNRSYRLGDRFLRLIQ
ncbi:MAG: cell filamentation protein Fic [Acidobacteria bacterium]|nr:MAG: cell filamentation protein Fic [Acidobacteriota bacterium]